jgi:hypothetical protein
MDVLLRVAELATATAMDSEEERENINSSNHVVKEQHQSDTAQYDYDVQRAKSMKKNQNFFFLHSLLTEMVDNLNERLGRMPHVAPMILWTDFVGDERRKQRGGQSKKISVIDLLSETKTAQFMTITQKRSVAGKIQIWIKKCRFKSSRKELLGWQQGLLVDLTKTYRVQIF